jgi:IS30 family transposase
LFSITNHKADNKRHWVQDGHKDASLFLATPQSIATRANENTNWLIRGFSPKGADFNLVTKEKLNWVQNSLKERQQQTLEFNSLPLNY